MGKMDLVVDLNFRMDSSALYSDIVLPAASWYEKADMNSTDMHSFIHPLSAAIAPVWESKTDWDIFKELARVTSEAARKYLPEPQVDIVALAAGARFGGRDHPAAREGLVQGRMRGDPREDHAQARRGAPRLHQALRQVHHAGREREDARDWARTATITCARTSTTK